MLNLTLFDVQEGWNYYKRVEFLNVYPEKKTLYASFLE